MRTCTWLYSSALLLLIFASSAIAQTRAAEDSSPAVATATPIVNVTVESPREINLGKAATFTVIVTNKGKSAAHDVVVVTSIPEHVELAETAPEPIEIAGRIARFRIGDLAPGATSRVTLVTIPRSTDPIKMNATTTFETATQSMVLVRQPALKLTAQVSPQAAIGSEVDWVIQVTNTGDGRADDIVVTPNLVEGEVQDKALQQAVKIGSLKPGETKEIQFTVIPTRRGTLAASFKGSNPDGLESTEESSFQVLQAFLAVTAAGPTVQPLAREATYEIQVTNPGDAPAGSTMVVAKVPAGLQVTAAAENSYDHETRTLRWRITQVRPGDVVRLPFRAEGTAAGDQTLQIVAECEKIDDATTTHTISVISRPNLVVTVLNDQELTPIADPIGFKVTVINAGSKLAEDLKIRVAMPDGLKPIDSESYQVKDGQIEFPAQKLASGEKVTLAFRALGNRVGEHRVRVLVSGSDLTGELAFEGSTYCYSNEEVPVSNATPGASPNDA